MASSPTQPPSSSSSSSSSTNWRAHIKDRQLVTQISSILVQRLNWAPLLHTLNLSSKLTPSLFFQVLLRTKPHPHVSLSFFTWAMTHLGLKPDLKSQCHLARVLLGSGLSQPGKDLLDSIFLARHPASVVGEAMVRACIGGKDSNFVALDQLIEIYSREGLVLEGLEMFRRMRGCRMSPSVGSCNRLLDVVHRKEESRLAWCVYGAMVRDGLVPDKATWSVIARILLKDGKFERIVRFLDAGICSSVMYSAVVEGCCEVGDFGGAFDRLDEMSGRKLEPGFSIYSSLLDGACRYGNSEVVDRVMGLMMEKGLLPVPERLSGECDSVIQKLGDLGRVYAAMMFFERSSERKIGLHDATYRCLLKALSKKGRVEEAIDMYRVIAEKGVVMKSDACNALADLLCSMDYGEEGCETLKDIISRGFSPCTSSLSNFISLQCSKHMWSKVEDLLDVILAKELLPDALCCCSLVEHYCSSGQIDKALSLHNKMSKLRASLDLATYNILLDELVKLGRVHDAVGMFGYMTEREVLDSVSFTTIIRGLCRATELRTAMKLHDEMLKRGLKPDKATYTNLIREFNR